MSLLDSIVGEVASGLSGGSTNVHPGLAEAVIGMLGNNAQGGGMQALVSAFEQQGLSHILNSWVGTGANAPISTDQINAVLGSDQVKAIAQGLGLSPQAASSGLATLLPQMIDKLSPGGQVPAGAALNEGLALLRGLTGGR
jgi:uncharacterized protein YidB (DUF937 family)